MTRQFFCISAVLWACCGAAASADDRWVVLPEAFTLTGRESSQRLLVQSAVDDQIGAQQRENLVWSSSDPTVAEVSGGVVVPKGDGETTISVSAGDRSASAKAIVRGMSDPVEWSFRNDVLPVLSKAGCNSGACHGALAGKGGFRLSLRGYDPPTDYFNIVKQNRGRRVELSDPGRSLFLAKPSGAIPHKGGLRFEVDSREYRILSEWIAAGAAEPKAEERRVVRLHVYPERSLHTPGEIQQVVVQAEYSDGALHDVTSEVKWSSANEAVCRVDDNGLATTVGPGEGAISAWYSSKIAIARFTVPYPSLPADAAADARKPRNFIDEEIDSQLARLNLPASPACGDADFIRRATVDAIGRLPTADETRAFLADPAADKRDRLIERLLAREEFVDYWTYKWCDMLTLNGNILRPEATKAYYMDVRKNVEANAPWDQFVRSVVTSSGDSFVNGATNFYAVNQTPEEMVENACQAFLGLSIGCAKCHNHPLEKWSNDQYYAAANMFSRVRTKGWGGDPRGGNGQRTLYTIESGELVQPRTGKPQPPTPLDGEPVAMDDPTDRRIHFANWLASPENPYFARSITNRVWANYFGVGLVEGIDDMRDSNPASNDRLLGAAAAFLVEKKFDMKELMRAILQSNAYQRTSKPLEGNRDERRFYSRYYPRRMMAEVLHDAIVDVTEAPTKFEFIEYRGDDRQKVDFYPLGTRAIELYDSAVENYFLATFGRNTRNIVCECERSDQPTLVQALHISNGKTLNEKLRAAGGRVDKVVQLRKAGMSNASLIDEIYLLCLSRYPSETQRRQLAAVLPEPGAAEERQIVEDLFWGVMSSREFLFNH